MAHAAAEQRSEHEEPVGGSRTAARPVREASPEVAAWTKARNESPSVSTVSVAAAPVLAAAWPRRLLRPDPVPWGAWTAPAAVASAGLYQHSPGVWDRVPQYVHGDLSVEEPPPPAPIESCEAVRPPHRSRGVAGVAGVRYIIL